ncbi:MAG TPA: glycosyltransferase family 39 protein [Polyangiaceae bacterium]|nr:glycosyltransferase family 39 protein [Polyangiaceae bacterium]
MKLRVTFVCLLAFLLAAVLAHSAFHGFANSGDEYSYLFQAQLFASGRLSSPSPPAELWPSLQLDHVISDGMMRSKYFPGWSALLTLGVWLGSPWLITPICAAVAGFAIYASSSPLSGKGPALFGMACAVGSPFFLLNSANYQPHMAALVLAAGALACALRAPLARRWAFGAGLAWGALCTVRPIDSALMVPVLACLLRKQRTWRDAALAALPLVAVIFVYNKLQFGGFFRSGYALYQPTFEKLYPGEGRDLALGHLLLWQFHASWLADCARWLVPAVFLSPFGVAVASSRARRIVLLIAGPVLLEVSFLKSFAGDSDGPRYLFLLILPVALLVAEFARALEGELSAGRFGLVPLLLGSWLIASPFVADRVAERVDQVERRRNVYRLAEQQHLSNAVVLLGRTDNYRAHWFARNDPDFDAAVLYVAECDPRTRFALQSWRPGRRFYRYVNESKPARLSRLAADSANAVTFAACR